MKELLDYRKQLDEIDTTIRECFEKRMDIVKEVAIYKIQNNVGTLDSSRENQMKINHCSKLKNKNYEKYYLEILESFLKTSKEYQDVIKNLQSNK